MAERAPLVYGKYQLLELLARGGMAEVFQAKSHGVEGFEKILVIKRILPELSENSQFVEMFINEAKIAVTLSHANIVQVFDLGRADGTYFIAMEYVAGSDLATVLRRSQKYERALPAELAVFIVSELAKGLDYAHRRRDAEMQPLHIVHRDVSPQNALLSFEGEVKLTDFGIAKARTTVEDRTEAGVLKGKYAYMAPEQARGEEVDARTDLFALGTVLYETLTGENPFFQASAYDTLKKVREGEPVPIGEHNADLPEELTAIVHRAMSPNPADRHENAGRLYEDLIQFLYSSGRRVGAHDLSRYLDDLRLASERGRARREGDSLRAAFESGVAHDGLGATPSEVPRRRGDTTGGGRGKSSTTGGGSRARGTTGARPGTGVGRPQAERRDVSVLTVCTAPDDPLADTRIRELVRRSGGLLTEQGPGSGTSADRRWRVAVFGAKHPDGRDPENAARCALSTMRAAAQAGESPAHTTFQAAIHSGRVLVDIAGELIRDERYDKLVTETRRTCAKAGYGDVLATEQAERAIRRFFEVESDDDENIHRVLRERDVAQALGRFVGRRDELRRIGEVLAFANKGNQRVLALIGEAGTGKSRALLETMRRLRLGGHDVAMYIARISRQSRDVPMAGIQEMLRAILGIEEFDPEDVIRQKVGRVRELGLPRAEVAAVEMTLGLAVESAELPVGDRPLRTAMARIATRLGQDRLTVFAFDGVEAVDDESLALLYRLLKDARTARIVIVLAYRPGHVHAWSDLPGYDEVVFTPFDDDDVARLTAARLGVEEVPMELLREVSSKSGGNPLYVEEYLRALTDAGAVVVSDESKVSFKADVAAVEVPKTLRGIVSARLSRVSPTERHLLQLAAVAGNRFHSDLLEHISEEDEASVASAMALLEQRGIVIRQQGTEFAFTHELIGEVLRDGLPLDAQKEMHLAVAVALEELYPEHTDEMAERLASHYRQGGNRDKSIDYLVRAADRLETEQSLSGAITNLTRAIEMLTQLANPDRDRILALHWRVGDLSFRCRELAAGAKRMATALELAEGLGRDEYVARFAMMRGQLLGHANQFAEGAQWLDRARQVARQIGDTELLRDVNVARAESDTRNGNYGNAIKLFNEALQLARETGNVRAQVRCLIPLALAYAGRSDGEAALETIEAARALTVSSTDRFDECALLKTESLVHFFVGDRKRAIAASGRALELAKEYGFHQEAAVNAHNQGEGYLREGDYKRAFALLRYSYEVTREHGFQKLQYANMRVLGFIDAVKFGSAEGRDRIVEACEYAAERGFIWDHIQSRHMLAFVDHAQDQVPEAIAGFREVVRLAAEHGHRHYEQAAQEALAAIERGEPVKLPN